MHLYNIDSDLDAAGDWAPSLTQVPQQVQEAKAKSRFHQIYVNI